MIWAVERKENPLHLSMGKQTEPAASQEQGAHQIPSLKMQGGPSFPSLPSCSFQMEGHQTPSSGAAAATAQRQPIGPRASAEHKNSLLEHAESTEAADWSGVRRDGEPGSSLSVPAGTLVQVRPRLTFWRDHCSRRIPGKGGEGRLGAIWLT